MPLKLFKEKIILNNVEKFIEPLSWNEFKASENDNGIYKIYNDELPIMRDLKAFLNILTSVQTIYEKITTKYSLVGAAIGKGLTIIEDLNVFYQNIKIYRSTNSIVTCYIDYLKQFTIDAIIPEIIKGMKQLAILFTTENLDNIAEFIIEQVITLEQYQDKFQVAKQKKLLPKNSEKKEEILDDNFTKFIKYCDENIKKIYGLEDYTKIFMPDVKTEKFSIEYYPEKKSDTDTVKNLKLLLNGIIGIKKVQDDHDARQQSSNFIDKGRYLSSFISNLHKALTSFSDFDYQAIIAEKSTPFTNEIKNQLKKVNEMLETLSCHADQLELELRLKEGKLLNQMQLLIDKYNQIMCELRIPINFIKQKNIYYKKRFKARIEKITNMDEQINTLKGFMGFRLHALKTLPPFVREAINQYIESYYDQICMNRSNLDIYKQYLQKAKEPKRNIKEFIQNQFEYLANSCGMTVHSELMSALSNRLLYLIKQKSYVMNKNKKILEHYKVNPFDYIQLSDIKELGQQGTIIKLLKSHEEKLQKGNNELLSSAVMKKEIKPSPTDSKIPVSEPVFDKDKNKNKLLNLITVTTKEITFFNKVIKHYEEENEIIPVSILEKEEGLSSKTVLLLYELRELSELPGHSFK